MIGGASVLCMRGAEKGGNYHVSEMWLSVEKDLCNWILSPDRFPIFQFPAKHAGNFAISSTILLFQKATDPQTECNSWEVIERYRCKDSFQFRISAYLQQSGCHDIHHGRIKTYTCTVNYKCGFAMQYWLYNLTWNGSL